MENIRQRKLYNLTANTGQTSFGDILTTNPSGDHDRLFRRVGIRNWHKMIFRLLFAAILGLAIYLGPFYSIALVLLVGGTVSLEIIHMGHTVYKADNLPAFRTLAGTFFITTNYFFFGESFIDYLKVLVKNKDWTSLLSTHHRFISCALYCASLVGFVLTLKKKHYMKQFMLFGWTHVTLLIVLTSMYAIILNILEGMIWFLLPVAMIITNGVMENVVGMLFGKTPLIKLSPRKTWEGFIGGGLFTVLFSLLFSTYLFQHDYLTCPSEPEALSSACQHNTLFIPDVYFLPEFLEWLHLKSITIYPYMKHTFVLSIFASILGPFSGFFASGFKRAFKIKELCGTIPGFGSVVDRVDCQILMSLFTYVYLQAFIQGYGAGFMQRTLKKVYSLPQEDQLEFYHLLTESLIRRGILQQ